MGFSKEQINQTKHKISFTDAAEVFFDLLAITVNDEAHSWEERRFITIGETDKGKSIVVFHTETEIEIRIISARKPTRTLKIKL